jgi:archaeal type IV pilus assembly protein PilA
MKKMWKMKKSKEAVSPVIATILMVAITVVLAAVLYVMVMGFGSNPDSNPTMSMTDSATGAANEQKVLVADVSDPISITSTKISLVIAGVAHTFDGATGTYVDATPDAQVTLTFVNLVAGDGKINAGDYFLVKNTTPTESMVFSVLYGSESKSIGSADWTSF